MKNLIQDLPEDNIHFRQEIAGQARNRWSSESRGEACFHYAESRQRKTKSMTRWNLSNDLFEIKLTKTRSIPCLIKYFLLPLQTESNTLVLQQDGGFELFDPIVVPDVSLEDKRL